MNVGIYIMIKSIVVHARIFRQNQYRFDEIYDNHGYVFSFKYKHVAVMRRFEDWEVILKLTHGQRRFMFATMGNTIREIRRGQSGVTGLPRFQFL